MAACAGRPLASPGRGSWPALPSLLRQVTDSARREGFTQRKMSRKPDPAQQRNPPLQRMGNQPMSQADVRQSAPAACALRRGCRVARMCAAGVFGTRGSRGVFLDERRLASGQALATSLKFLRNIRASARPRSWALRRRFSIPGDPHVAERSKQSGRALPFVENGLKRPGRRGGLLLWLWCR